MRRQLACSLVLVALTLTCVSRAIKDHHADDDHEKDPLSKKHHYSDDAEHEHDVEYDHEAFLGEDEAHSYDDLTPEESKEKLMLIFNKIDVNSDGFVVPSEMKQWIQNVQTRTNTKDMEYLWKDISPENQPLEFDHYFDWAYTKEIYDNDDKLSQYKESDRHKWQAADVNKDGRLNYEEFTSFEHPEEAEHMKEVVVKEKLAEEDGNKDGFISYDEFMASNNHSVGMIESITNESLTRKFKDVLDINKDGRLDTEEIRRWQFPDGYKHDIEDEVEHLMKEADLDKDNKLSREEMKEKYEVFVSSKATDYGDQLHEEL